MVDADALELRAANGASELHEAPGDLEHLIHPLDVRTFFERYWDRQALFLRGKPEKFAGLFDRAAFDRAVHHCADLKVGYTDEKGWPAHFNIKPEQVPEMLKSGKTVCASVIDPGNPELTAFVNRVKQSFALLGRFFFNSYLSPDGAGFGLHLDHHPVWILQIEGRKRWWYSPEPALRQVMTNVSFPKDRQELKLPWVTVTRPHEADLREAVLTPGDVLYLPKGTWHRAQALGGSLGLTLAMESIAPLEIIQLALRPHLNQVVFRDLLPAFSKVSVDNEAPAQLETVFATSLDRLRSLLDSITPTDLYQLWRQAQVEQAEAPRQVAKN
jgi:ribosomal protein L16 Arg81 hydroxylase